MGLKLLGVWLAARLSEKSTWVSIAGFSTMFTVGLNPMVIQATTIHAPEIVAGIWGITQAFVADKK